MKILTFTLNYGVKFTFSIVILYFCDFLESKKNNIMNKFLLSILVSIASFLGCKTTNYNLDNLPEDRIIFGSSGGFAGSVTEFMLLDNGQLFVKKNHAPTYTELISVPKRLAKKAFKMSKALKLEEIKSGEPGNMNNFIGIKGKDVDHQISWSAGQEFVRKDLQEIFNLLTKLTKDKQKQ